MIASALPATAPSANYRSRKRFPGITVRVLVFFAANPDEELLVEDLCAKFGMHRKKTDSLATAVRDRWLTLTKRQIRRGGQPHNVYSAGPVLLDSIGKTCSSSDE